MPIVREQVIPDMFGDKLGSIDLFRPDDPASEAGPNNPFAGWDTVWLHLRVQASKSDEAFNLLQAIALRLPGVNEELSPENPTAPETLPTDTVGRYTLLLKLLTEFEADQMMESGGETDDGIAHVVSLVESTLLEL